MITYQLVYLIFSQESLPYSNQLREALEIGRWVPISNPWGFLADFLGGFFIQGDWTLIGFSVGKELPTYIYF